MNTPGIQLSDLFYALQMRIKVLEELLQSTKDGSRSETDFKWRFITQSHLVAADLKKIKPLIDSMLIEGNEIISSISVDTEKEVFSFKC